MDSTAFLRLVRAGDLTALKNALAAQPELVNEAGPHPSWGGRPQPLHVAIETRQREVFDLLLDHGADVDGAGADYGDWSPLMLAALQGEGSDEIWSALIRRGARIGVAEALLNGLDDRLPNELPGNVPNTGSWLNFARTPAAVDRLVALGAPLELPDEWGTTPMAALSKRGLPLVAALRRHGVAPSPEDLARLNDRTCAPVAPAPDSVIFAAVSQGHRELAAWLLAARDANPNARAPDRSRQTLLHEAAWSGDLELVRLLVAAGADLHAVDEEHHATPEHWAEVAVEVRKVAACQAVADWLHAAATKSTSPPAAATPPATDES